MLIKERVEMRRGWRVHFLAEGDIIFKQVKFWEGTKCILFMKTSSTYSYNSDMRILLVEDEIKLNLGIKKGLVREGYSVDSAFDGEKGLLMAEDLVYDLIILDVLLPKKNGFVICKNLRENKVNTPILLLTAKDAIEDKIEGLDNGADDYLVKPFKLEELKARIRALLRRPLVTVPAIIELKSLTLNSNSQLVAIDNHEIPLTLKEFRLLEYLMRNLNHVLSREQILDHVWDSSYESFTNIVDVHIKNLRRKLGKNAGLLQTVRGVGYMLKDHE